VALAGVLTAYAAEALGARLGLLVFGVAVIGLALVLTQVWVRDTLPWAHAEAAKHRTGTPRAASGRAIRRASPRTPAHGRSSR
jgi:hypothetical protein